MLSSSQIVTANKPTLGFLQAVASTSSGSQVQYQYHNYLPHHNSTIAVKGLTEISPYTMFIILDASQSCIFC